MTRTQLRRRLRLSLHDAKMGIEARRDPRYRELAKGYRLPDGSRRVYCFHVRKTGGTSLHYAFLGLGGEDPADVHRRMAAAALHRTVSAEFAFAAHQRYLVEQGDYFYGWSHLPAHRLALPPETFTVVLLRDPLRRVVSYFRYLTEGDAPGMPFPVDEAQRAVAARGFDAFLDDVPRSDLLRQLFMFSASFDVSEAAERIGSCSAVVFTERYDDEVAALARRLQLPLAVRRERVSSAPVELSAAQRDRLRASLEPEYELLRRLESAL